MNIKKEIKALIGEALKKMEIKFEGDCNLDHPQDLKFGDWTTNIALQVAGKAGKNPREFAEQIRSQIELNENIEKIEIAGPGYLNFYLSKIFFKRELEQNLASPNFAPKTKILLEHSSPNLFKPFHIGHMVNNSIGESLGRIFKYIGADLIQISFPSDAGPGIAKTIWALKEQEKKVEELSLQEIADAYVFGVAKYKEKKEVKEIVDKINIQVYNYLNKKEVPKEFQKYLEFYKKGQELSLAHFNEVSSKLGSQFQKMIFESEAEEVGKEIIKKNIPKVFQEVENKDRTRSVIFEGKNYTNVFINSAGFGTYLTKDIGLLKIKKENFSDVEKSLVITDVEQKQHFEMVVEAGEKIAEISDFVKKSEYLQHGRMNFTGNEKISSRYGNVPLALDVIKRVQENILEKMVGRDFDEEEKKEISEKIAIANLKYSILKVTSGKNISFDLEKDTNPQGNTGSFLLYTLVRAKSIFRKLGEKNILEKIEEKKTGLIELEQKFLCFNEEVKKAFQNRSPHFVATYLYELAKLFNSFYAETKILDEKNPDFIYNLKIVERFEDIMERGLDLMGIERIEKM